MKKMQILLLLIALVNNLTSMQVQDKKVETILDLPNEMLDNIVKQVLGPKNFAKFITDVKNWSNIFESPNEPDLSLIANLAKTCTGFRDLCQYIFELRKEKFKELFTSLKEKVLEEYKWTPKEELNKGLISILNKLNKSMCINKKTLEQGVKLVLAGADSDTIINNIWESNSILMIASRVGYKEAVEILIKAKVNINATNKSKKTPLIMAVENGHKEIAGMLIKEGADVGSKNYLDETALMYAARNGHKEAVEMLIRAGADVNAKEKFGKTALIYAVENGHKEVIKTLIKSNADVNVEDSYCMTALIYAVENGHKEIAGMLITAGADVNARISNKESALIHAVEINRKDIVETLINAGADVNVQDNDGETALMYAAAFGYKDIVETLIKSGADVNVKNNAGETALMHAKNKDHEEEIAEILEMYLR